MRIARVMNLSRGVASGRFPASSLERNRGDERTVAPDDFRKPATHMDLEHRTHDDDRVSDLVTRWRGGDQEALCSLLELESGWLTRFLERQRRGTLRRLESVEDLSQEVRLRLLRTDPPERLASLRELRGYLARVAQNLVYDKLRAAGAAKRNQDNEHRAASVELHLEGVAADDESGPGTRAERHLQWEKVETALADLDEGDRILVEWRVFDDLPFVEIAGRLEATPDAVRMRLRRILERLSTTLHSSN